MEEDDGESPNEPKKRRVGAHIPHTTAKNRTCSLGRAKKEYKHCGRGVKGRGGGYSG